MFYNVFFGYKKNKILFNNMGIDFQEGKITVICGHNGAGKTTLLKLISGILPSAIKDPVGWYVPPTGGLIQHFSLYEHLQFLEMNETIQKFVDNAIELFEVKSFLRKRISTLSTGQVMIAAIIVAIASGNEFLLLDEPFGSLDPVNSEKLSNFFCELTKSGKTIIITSHDLYLSSETADQILFIKDGKISWDANKEFPGKKFSVEELKERYLKHA
mgnify:CR=1 FL=1